MGFTIQNGKVVIAAKFVVYAGEPEEYYSFITPEAYDALLNWMDYRAADGERITVDSWIMRDLYPTKNVPRAAKRSLATNPKKLKAPSISKLLQRALQGQNLRPVLSMERKGQRRHEWKTDHGYRKFLKSRVEQVMKPINVELLMGHSGYGVSKSYSRPTEKEVLEDYLKAGDLP